MRSKISFRTVSPVTAPVVFPPSWPFMIGRCIPPVSCAAGRFIPSVESPLPATIRVRERHVIARSGRGRKSLRDLRDFVTKPSQTSLNRLLGSALGLALTLSLLTASGATAHTLSLREAERYAQRIANRLGENRYYTDHANVIVCRRRGGRDRHWVNCYTRWSYAFDGDTTCTAWIGVQYRSKYSRKKSWVGPLLERCY